MLVCKPWMDACDDPSLNLVFDLETWFESSRISNLWFSIEFEQKVDSFLRCVVDRSQGRLTDIRIRHCSDLSVSYAAERCPNLEVLWIKSCISVTDESIAKIAASCPELRELDISNSIMISQKALKMVESSCKNVKIIREPPRIVRLSQEEATSLRVPERRITSHELLDTLRRLNTDDN